jgi:cbb3-type cytochrome oxidase maturation protein
MDILYLLIGLALLLMGVAVALFVWTVRNRQYEDLDGPAYRILLDDDDTRIPGARINKVAGQAAALGNGRQPELPLASPVSRRVDRGNRSTGID